MNAALPATGDARWADWRRMQVTQLVRRIYLNAIAVKPRLVVSAAVIAFGAAPVDAAGWLGAEAYWRVYQDWRAWLEEGILDVAMPMVYRREHDRTQASQFDQWLDWFVPRHYGRAVVAGEGAFVNSVEGTLAQTRRGLAPRAGERAAGVALYSMATASAAVVANPLSLPPAQNTPVRNIDELASGLTSGQSGDGRTRYEPVDRYPPVFADAAFVPALPWKAAPVHGHLLGFIVDEDGEPFDGAAVRLVDTKTGIERSTESDGGGFYGFVDLPPGRYVLHGTADGRQVNAIAVTITAGLVTEADTTARSVRHHEP